MIIFRLSGEEYSLPIDEVRALYEAYNTEFEVIDQKSNLILVKNDLLPKILSRLALTHELFLVDTVTDLKSLDRVLLDIHLKKGESFCVRCLGFSNNSKQEKLSGGIIYDNLKNPVDLLHSDVLINLIKINDKIYICFEKYEIETFNHRDPNDRPFFSPLALDPKLARLFLNLARLKEGDRVLDPFCGSGSILIEAALMDLDAYGTDRDRKMVGGSNINLSYYGLSATVKVGDATDIKMRGLDAIVSDPPYARASKMFSKELGDLYSEFLGSSFNALKRGGHLVIAIPHDVSLAYASIGFKIVSEHLYYVHKSLTRKIFVLKKP